MKGPARAGATGLRGFVGALALLALAASPAQAQRFGGDFGGGGGFWLAYVDPGIAAASSFDRDVGGVIAMGGRGFLQTGRVRLGGGAFSGSFVDEGSNASGQRVQGGLSAGGFIAEYLVVRRNIEVAVGGLAGGGTLTVEALIAVPDGLPAGVERLDRRKEPIFVGYPWVRVGYNPAPFVNFGLQLGYLVGSEDVGGLAVGIDVLAGLIP